MGFKQETGATEEGRATQPIGEEHHELLEEGKEDHYGEDWSLAKIDREEEQPKEAD